MKFFQKALLIFFLPVFLCLFYFGSAIISTQTNAATKYPTPQINPQQQASTAWANALKLFNKDIATGKTTLSSYQVPAYSGNQGAEDTFNAAIATAQKYASANATYTSQSLSDIQTQDATLQSAYTTFIASMKAFVIWNRAMTGLNNDITAANSATGKYQCTDSGVVSSFQKAIADAQQYSENNTTFEKQTLFDIQKQRSALSAAKLAYVNCSNKTNPPSGGSFTYTQSVKCSSANDCYAVFGIPTPISKNQYSPRCGDGSTHQMSDGTTYTEDPDSLYIDQPVSVLCIPGSSVSQNSSTAKTMTTNTTQNGIPASTATDTAQNAINNGSSDSTQSQCREIKYAATLDDDCDGMGCYTDPKTHIGQCMACSVDDDCADMAIAPPSNFQCTDNYNWSETVEVPTCQENGTVNACVASSQQKTGYCTSDQVCGDAETPCVPKPASAQPECQDDIDCALIHGFPQNAGQPFCQQYPKNDDQYAGQNTRSVYDHLIGWACEEGECLPNSVTVVTQTCNENNKELCSGPSGSAACKPAVRCQTDSDCLVATPYALANYATNARYKTCSSDNSYVKLDSNSYTCQNPGTATSYCQQNTVVGTTPSPACDPQKGETCVPNPVGDASCQQAVACNPANNYVPESPKPTMVGSSGTTVTFNTDCDKINVPHSKTCYQYNTPGARTSVTNVGGPYYYIDDSYTRFTCEDSQCVPLQAASDIFSCASNPDLCKQLSCPSTNSNTTSGSNTGSNNTSNPSSTPSSSSTNGNTGSAAALTVSCSGSGDVGGTMVITAIVPPNSAAPLTYVFTRSSPNTANTSTQTVTKQDSSSAIVNVTSVVASTIINVSATDKNGASATAKCIGNTNSGNPNSNSCSTTSECQDGPPTNTCNQDTGLTGIIDKLLSISPFSLDISYKAFSCVGGKCVSSGTGYSKQDCPSGQICDPKNPNAGCYKSGSNPPTSSNSSSPSTSSNPSSSSSGSSTTTNSTNSIGTPNSNTNNSNSKSTTNSSGSSTPSNPSSPNSPTPSPSGNSSTSPAACYYATNVMGHCTTVIDKNGNCGCSIN